VKSNIEVKKRLMKRVAENAEKRTARAEMARLGFKTMKSYKKNKKKELRKKRLGLKESKI